MMALTVARNYDGNPLRTRPDILATHRNGLRLSGRSDVTRDVFEGGDKGGEVGLGDSSRLADLDASELPGSEEQIDLVAADVQQVRDIFHGVGLHAGLRGFPR